MIALANLAIVAAKHPDCMMQIYNNSITVFVGKGRDRKNISCGIYDNEYIEKIIAFLNFGKEIQ